MRHSPTSLQAPLDRVTARSLHRASWRELRERTQPLPPKLLILWLAFAVALVLYRLYFSCLKHEKSMYANPRKERSE